MKIRFVAKPAGVCLILCCLATCRLSAQTLRPVDVLVEDATAGLMVGNLEEFNRKLSATISNAWFPIPEETLGDIFYSALGSVDVSQAVDRQGIGGVMFFGDFSTITWIYPLQEVSGVADEFGVDPDRLSTGAAWETGNHVVGMNDDHLFVSSPMFEMRDVSGPAVRIENPLATRQTIGELAGFEDHETFGDCDAVLMLGGSRAAEFWRDVPSRLFGPRGLANLSGMNDPGDRDMWEQIRAAGREVKFALTAIDLDAGVHLRSKTFFEETPDSIASRLIDQLRAGDQASSLRHLPDKQILVATSAQGDGTQNVLIARSLLRLVVDNFSPSEGILYDDDQRAFYVAFDNIWKQLTGIRIGLYRNDGPIGDDGELALVAIFESRDSAKVLAELPTLVEIVNRGLDRQADDAKPTIRFQYLPQAQTLGNLEVDVLQVDTSRMRPGQIRRFNQFFGGAAGRIRLAEVPGHLVMFVGSNPALLETTLENLQTDNPGLASHPAIRAAQEKLDPRKKMELHLSAKNLNNIFSAMIRQRDDLGKYDAATELTSFGLVLEDDRLGFDIWIPDGELNRGVKLLSRIGR